MSDIPKARAILEEAIENSDEVHTIRAMRQALAHMLRVIEIRRAPEVAQHIDADTRKKVKYLARTTTMTMADIARVCGLRNQGRVSEILNGKR